MVVALLMSAAAGGLFFGVMWPWIQSPRTTHVTLMLAGMRFAGRELFWPLGVFVSLALASAF